MAETVIGTAETLEELIKLARDRRVSARVELATRQVVESVMLELGGTEEKESYLFIADYYFLTDHEPHRISKIYLQGYKGESLETRAANRRIANSRLREDYRRLREAGIEVEENLFEEFQIA